MSGSSEGDEFHNINIDEMDKRLKNVGLNGDHKDDVDDSDDDDDAGGGNGNDNDNNECSSNSEHEQSTMSQANYYDEPPIHLNSLNHLFHIDFMRSMQNLRAQDKRFDCKFELMLIINAI